MRQAEGIEAWGHAATDKGPSASPPAVSRHVGFDLAHQPPPALGRRGRRKRSRAAAAASMWSAPGRTGWASIIVLTCQNRPWASSRWSRTTCTTFASIRPWMTSVSTCRASDSEAGPVAVCGVVGEDRDAGVPKSALAAGPMLVVGRALPPRWRAADEQEPLIGGCAADEDRPRSRGGAGRLRRGARRVYIAERADRHGDARPRRPAP